MDAPGLRLESILGHCERHALLHMAPKWFDHWTTWAGLTFNVYRYQGSNCLAYKKFQDFASTLKTFSRTLSQPNNV